MSGPIALVLGPDEFTAAQSRRGVVEWSACRGGELDDAGLRRVCGMLERGGMRGRRVRVALAEGATITNLMELPSRASGAPVDDLAARELGRIMRGQKGELIARALEVPQPARRGALEWYLAAGVASAEAERIAEALARIGLRVEHVEPRAIALGRAFAGVLARRGVCAGIEVGAAQSRFVAVVDGVLAYERAIAIGWLSDPAEVLVKAGRISRQAAEAQVRGALRSRPDARTPEVRGALERASADLAREFAASAGFVLERYRADALGEACVVAPEALGLVGAIGATLEVVARQASWAGAPADDSPGLGAAVGLLGHGGSMCLPRAMSERRLLRRRVVQGSWATGVAASAAMASWLCVTLRPERSVTALTSEVALADEATDALSAELAGRREELAQGVQLLRATRATQDRVNWSALLMSLGDLAGEDVRLTQVAVTPASEGARVGVRGEARDQAALSRFVLALEGTKAFARVVLHESTTGGRDGAMTFSLSAALGEVGP
ncbi:MAG: hypothetical protein IT439_12790 [Phycisphaerales bacterium]|nr:hypothetical protein [Phycisphaerales bacterium]